MAMCMFCLFGSAVDERTSGDSASFAVPLAWQWKQMSQSNQLFSDFLLV